MTEQYRTEQESFWAGDFGNAYIDRNSDPRSVARRIALFAKILQRTRGVSRILELGANIGRNLLAIRSLIPDSEFGAVEINAKATKSLQRIPKCKVFRRSILDFDSPRILASMT